jgi:hypothetical protein
MNEGEKQELLAIALVRFEESLKDVVSYRVDPYGPYMWCVRIRLSHTDEELKQCFSFWEEKQRWLAEETYEP